MMLINLKILFLVLVVMFVSRLGATSESHSCPEPGHGPCYLCDK